MSKLGSAPAGVYADDGVTLQALIDGAGNEYSFNPSTNLIQMTGNISLSASPGTSVIFVNNSANNYTITLAAAGIGNFSVENLGSGSIQILTPPENRWPYSTDFSSTAWANYNTNHTVTNNTVASPVTGNITGATIGVTGGNAFSVTNNITNLTPNIEYTLEFYVKGNAGSVGQMLGFGVQSNVSGTPAASAKLTANWQRVFLKFATTNTNGTQLFLNLSGGTNCPGSISSGNSFYISDARIFKGDYKTFVQTSGSVINGVTNILGGDLINSSFVPTNTIANANYPRLDVQESSAGNYTISPNQQTNGVVLPEQNSGFLLIKSTASRGETFVLAASDSLNPYASDYILTGSNDDVIISQAVNSLRGKGGCVKLRAGTFLLNSPINMDADWVTLRGECVPHWGGYNNPWSAGGVAEESFPGGSKLKMLTPGTDIIHVGTTYINEQRHKGLGFEDLYFYGSQVDGSVTTQYGIYDQVNTDVSKIKGCFFHNLASAINVGWDSGQINNNSIQSCGGNGITLNFYYGCIFGNIIFDIGGSGIVINGTTAYGGIGGGVQITGNTIGSVGNSGILLINGGMSAIQGNTIQGVVSGHGIELNGSIKNAISGNTISIDNATGGYLEANLAGHGIYLHGSSKYNAITGNVLNNTSTGGTVTGYAVCLGLAGDTTETNNTVAGNICSGGKWNSGSATAVILDSSTGGTNLIISNVGQSVKGIAPTNPTIPSGTAYTNNSNGLQQLIVSGGSLSTHTVTRNSVVINLYAFSTSLYDNVVTLAPGDSYTPTWSTAPTFTVMQMTTGG